MVESKFSEFNTTTSCAMAEASTRPTSRATKNERIVCG